MAKTNLLYVITKLELGGAQTQLLQLIRTLDRSRYEVFLFTAASGILTGDAEAISGLRVHRSRYLERSINPFLDICAFFELISFIKKHRIHIVHTHSSKAGIVGRLAAAAAGVGAIFHTVHGWPFHRFQNPVVRTVYIMLERIAALATTKIIVVCQTDKARGMLAGIGTSSSYEIIPYAIDVRAFGKTAAGAIREELGIPSGAFVVGTIACFKPQKAPLDFLQLVRRLSVSLPDIVCVMAGDGVLRPEIESFIRRHGLERTIILAGWRRDIPRFLASCDVFVLTSYWEGMPISVLEAMASSLPVVVSNTGGVAEVVHHAENGFLFEPGDVDSCLSPVERLFRDNRLRQRMAVNARQRADSVPLPSEVARLTQRLYDNPQP